MSDIQTYEGQAVRLCDVFSEYAGKLRSINERLLSGWGDLSLPYAQDRLAIVLDQFEMIRKPLEKVIGTASQIVEQGEADQMLAEELTLRLAEIEVELRHATRLVHAVKTDAEKKAPKRLEEVARLRVAAGLNAMKGGPLRPNA